MVQVTRRPVTNGTNETSGKTIEDEPVRIQPLSDDDDEKTEPDPIDGTFIPGSSDSDSEESNPSDDLDDDVAGNDPKIN